MEEKKFTLFGTNLEKIPCFKKTFSVSIYSGIGAGFGYFILTSKIKRSTDVAMATFAGVTIAYWIYCRNNWSKQSRLTQVMNDNLHDVMLREGVKKPSDV